jgi:hypothetical protein
LACSLLGSGGTAVAPPAPQPAPESAPASAAPAATTPAAPAPAVTAPAPASGVDTNTSLFEASTELADLTKDLQIFVYLKKRFPVDIKELCTERKTPYPRIPPGGQLVIDKESKTIRYIKPK